MRSSSTHRVGGGTFKKIKGPFPELIVTPETLIVSMAGCYKWLQSSSQMGDCTFAITKQKGETKDNAKKISVENLNVINYILVVLHVPNKQCHGVFCCTV